MRLEKKGPGSGKLMRFLLLRNRMRKKLKKTSMLTEEPGCEIGVAV
jgi:hypothetical protein